MVGQIGIFCACWLYLGSLDSAAHQIGRGGFWLPLMEIFYLIVYLPFLIVMICMGVRIDWWMHAIITLFSICMFMGSFVISSTVFVLAAIGLLVLVSHSYDTAALERKHGIV